MTPRVALGAEIPALAENRFFEPGIDARFPGTGWAAPLRDLLAARGIEMVTADQALLTIERGEARASDYRLIQHCIDPTCERLAALGAVPWIIQCFESPLYASRFYDRLRRLSSPFRHFIGFLDEESAIAGGGRIHQLRFPILPALPAASGDWPSRKNRAALVAGNKFPRSCWDGLSPSPREWWRLARGRLERMRSPSLRLASRRNLLVRRLDLIEHLTPLGLLDLHGSGWQPLATVPRARSTRLRRVLQGAPIRRCADKRATLAAYRFALCIENTAWPGYFTEKIVDAMAAGCVPLYQGAPDLARWIPPQAFVDLSGLSVAEVAERIAGMGPQEALGILAAGRAYLDSEEGRRHLHETHARFLFELLLDNP